MRPRLAYLPQPRPTGRVPPDTAVHTTTAPTTSTVDAATIAKKLGFCLPDRFYFALVETYLTDWTGE